MAKILRDEYEIALPQVRPLSPGEILGCTSKRLNLELDFVLTICDGRFHIESMMISNPHYTYYKYSPYDKSLTHETYEYEQMLALRMAAIAKAKEAKCVGVVLGTLGSQGSPKVVKVFDFVIDLFLPSYMVVLCVLVNEMAWYIKLLK